LPLAAYNVSGEYSAVKAATPGKRVFPIQKTRTRTRFLPLLQGVTTQESSDE